MKATHTVSLLLDAKGAARAVRVPTFRLRVTKGPDKNKEKRAAAQRVRIGANPHADFPLTDATVSALHCELVQDERGARIIDLGSRNGVVVSGRRVRDAFLLAKDELQLGATTLRFTLLDEAEEHALPGEHRFGRLEGTSLPMREAYRALAKAAQSGASVLITGETGTGKELAAEALVAASDRRDQPFVVVDCGRLPATLAESELFGHEKGAFTGADTARAGAFERANGGTVFLDEIGELPLELQPKLLGALERRQVQRLGGAAPIPLDVRIIAATHRELDRAVNAGTFRADLFYRLAVIEVHLPALRERRDDIPLLVRHFLDELPGARVDTDTLQVLHDADYPGNVRELKNAVERAVAGFDVQVQKGAAGPRADLTQPFSLQKERLVCAFEKDYFGRQLEACDGNITEAARRSGLSRVYLSGLLRRLGLT